MAPTPSLSGHPVIIGEICSYLPQHERTVMLRVDKQTYQIAGRSLYRHMVIATGQPSPFPIYDASLDGHSAPAMPPRGNRLLDYVELLDISETTLMSISEAYAVLHEPFPLLKHLETLVLRVHPESTAWPSHTSDPCGEGLQPTLLVLVGDFESLFRLSSHRRNRVSLEELNGPLGQAHMLWPSVRRLHHILPYHDPKPYPATFIYERGDCDITASLPNLIRYDLFFDFDKVERDSRYYSTTSRAESHFARSVAWGVRNTRRDLPMTIWLSDASQPAFMRRKGLIKYMVRQPVTSGAKPAWKAGMFRDWDNQALSERLACVEARICGAERDMSWCSVADGKGQYDPALLVKASLGVGDGNEEDSESCESEAELSRLDWEVIKAEDDGAEDQFLDDETETDYEDNSENDSDEDEDDYGRSRDYRPGRYEHEGWWYDRNDDTCYGSDGSDEEE